jgi:cytochrome c5
MPPIRNLAPVAIILAVAGWAMVAQAPVLAQRPHPDSADTTGSAALPPVPDDEPAETGLDIMQRICTPCHSIDFVTAVKRDRDEWSDTVNDMVNRGASATPEEIDRIVAYLATNFAAKKD